MDFTDKNVFTQFLISLEILYIKIFWRGSIKTLAPNITTSTFTEQKRERIKICKHFYDVKNTNK